MRITAFLTLCLLIASVASDAGAQGSGIANISVLQHTQGKYTLNVELTDSFPDVILLNGDSYRLREVETNEEVRLSQPVLWRSRPGKGVRFTGVDITYEKQYILTFRDFAKRFGESDFQMREGLPSSEDFEKGKGLAWQRSISPKIVQSDSTDGGLADLGFDLSLMYELPKRFEFDFEASVTSNKHDPTNHFRLNIYWRPGIWMPSRRVGIRPITLSLQEDASQTLKFHDLSARVFTTLFVHPFDGIQPIFMTAGIDEALRLSRDGEDYDEPRLHFQVQWGMVGLAGTGSRFFIDWRYLRVLDDIGDPRIDPNVDKERSYVEIGLVMPLYDDKNLTVSYADGDIAPMFTRNTSVEIGLEILFGGKQVFGSK